MFPPKQLHSRKVEHWNSLGNLSNETIEVRYILPSPAWHSFSTNYVYHFSFEIPSVRRDRILQWSLYIGLIAFLNWVRNSMIQIITPWNTLPTQIHTNRVQFDRSTLWLAVQRNTYRAGELSQKNVHTGLLSYHGSIQWESGRLCGCCTRPHNAWQTIPYSGGHPSQSPLNPPSCGCPPLGARSLASWASWLL